MSTLSTYFGDGSNRLFNVTFSFAAQSQVKVRVNGSDVTFTWTGPAQVQTTTAPATGALVEVYRSTDVAAPVVDFTDGAILVADDLDAAVNQPRSAAEEIASEVAALRARGVFGVSGEGSITLPSAASRANKYLAFGAAGDPLAVAEEATAGLLRTQLLSTAALEGAALVAFRGGRTVKDKLNDVVHAADYGVLADGTTDDTTALAAALATGKDVQLKPGTMVVSSITLSNNNQKLIGGRGCVIKRKANSAGNFITISAASCALEGLAIDGNSANQTYTYNDGEILITGAFAQVRNCRIDNAQSHGIRAVGGALAPVFLGNHIENCGDMGIFINNAGGGTDPAYGVCQNNTVVEFGIQGGGSGATASVGIAVRSVLGGWRVVSNIVRNLTSRANDQLGIEAWTNSNNIVVTGNVIDMSAANSGEFGLSVTGYGSVVGDNLILGTTSYAIEIIDRAVTVSGNIIRSPMGIGIAINLNSSHTDPGDLITVTGNTIENTSSVAGSNGAIIISGSAGTTPIGVTITGNTCHGLSNGIVVMDQVIGFTVAGNTVYNTGSSQTGIYGGGSDGTITGNTVVRTSNAGSGKGGQITLGGSGLLVSSNRISGNGQMDNAILVNSTAANVLIGLNLISGANNAVFSNSSAADIVVMGGMGTAGLALNAANYATDYFNSNNKTSEAQKVMIGLGSFTVDNLPTVNVPAGSFAYASNGRKNGEGAGAGTGVAVFRDATAWRAVDTGATVAA